MLGRKQMMLHTSYFVVNGTSNSSKSLSLEMEPRFGGVFYLQDVLSGFMLHTPTVGALGEP
jgi:hypothetical protein